MLPMKTLSIALFASLALVACSEEPTPEPAQTQAPVAAEPVKPTLAAPDGAFFAETFAATCPNAKPVSTSVCRRAGMGSPEVICEYGLGDDEYLRNETTLVQGETAWEIADPDSTCASGA